MRVLYLFLHFILKYTLWIYYPRFRRINRSKKYFSRTIFMSNHAASFMDPLVIAVKNLPIVFFMTRADIFTPMMKPILWAAQMFPIYRKHDGENTKEKNQEVFKKTNRVLKQGRSLLIFAEGFTDNTFVRRLKPVKKGAVRIGFEALESMNWEKKVYLQATGINYTDRNAMGSGIVVAYGNPVCLNNYRYKYEENPGKTINKLTMMMEIQMREQITDVRDENMTSFHENIMRITRKGMNENDSNKAIPLLKRREYSQKLAHWFNQQKVEENNELMTLKTDLEDYFKQQEKENINETPLYNVLTNKRIKFYEYLFIILLFPFMLLGAFHTYIPNRIVKNFVEKTFKRSVFWASVKMTVGLAAVGIFNIPILIILSHLTGVSFGILFFVSLFYIPAIFVMRQAWRKQFQLTKEMNQIEKKDVADLAMKRSKIEERIKELVPDF